VKETPRGPVDEWLDISLDARVMERAIGVRLHFHVNGVEAARACEQDGKISTKDAHTLSIPCRLLYTGFGGEGMFESLN
jgi:hypothetical protein